jgi:quinol-cytochrome oxidoreductase complex cytochrome b subunit
MSFITALIRKLPENASFPEVFCRVTGQMLMWHTVLIPVVLIAIIGAHVLLVPVRGVSHPIDTDAARDAVRADQ